MLMLRSIICPRASPPQFSETPSFTKQSSVGSDSTITSKNDELYYQCLKMLLKVKKLFHVVRKQTENS